MLPAAPRSHSRPYEEAAQSLRENEGQWAAYSSKGNFVALAGPGSGKTKVLTLKLARILNEELDVEDQKIACLTFSNECVREIERRLQKIGIANDDRVHVSTVHSFCLTKILRPYAHLTDLGIPQPVKVAPRKLRDELVEKSLNAQGFTGGMWDQKRDFDQARRTFLNREFIIKRANAGHRIAKAIVTYEAEMRAQSYIDFDDMAVFGARILREYPWTRKAIHAEFPVLMVDEYQDLGRPLHDIVLSLCIEGKTRLFAVGDPDQSIYGFAAADPKLLNDLVEEHAVPHERLPFNYRCGRMILNASMNHLREERPYESRAGMDGLVVFHPVDGTVPAQTKYLAIELIPALLEADPSLVPGDVGILYRGKWQAREVVQALAACGHGFVRDDPAAAYEKNALTRWIEDCAEFCGGGWRTGTPRLESLVRAWLRLNISVLGDAPREALARELVHFLLTHRTPDQRAELWLEQIDAALVRHLVSRELQLDYDPGSFYDLIEASRDGNSLGGLTLKRLGEQGGSPEHLNLLTLHKCKGREFRVAILVGIDDGILPDWRDSSAASRAEAKRLFYVGMTRAAEQLHILHSRKQPSPFVVDLQKRLTQPPQ